MSKWTVTTDPELLRRLGKLTEELGELTAVAARCIIQGVDEIDPGSGEINRARLEKEIADVYAQLDVTVLRLGLPPDAISARRAEKRRQMREWESLYLDADES